MPMNLVQTVLVTASGGVSQIDFTNIPQSGRELLIKASVKGTSNNSHIPLMMIINNNQNSSYPRRGLRGSTNSVANISSTATAIEAGYHSGNAGTANTFGTNDILIPNYTANTIKTISIDNALSNQSATQFDWFVWVVGNGFTVSGAVTSLTFYSNYSDNLAQNSIISIYTIT